ncbi:MAG: hypothetical protein R3E01_36680 [Pirellulaceae bacterium]|nr:hypothetical protein [Planctomycetales bacterium]
MRFVLLLFAFALVASAKGEEFFLVPTMPPDTSTAVVVEQSAITTSVPAQFAAYGSSGGMMTASARWQFPVTARRVFVAQPTPAVRPIRPVRKTLLQRLRQPIIEGRRPGGCG